MPNRSRLQEINPDDGDPGPYRMRNHRHRSSQLQRIRSRHRCSDSRQLFGRIAGAALQHGNRITPTPPVDAKHAAALPMSVTGGTSQSFPALAVAN